MLETEIPVLVQREAKSQEGTRTDAEEVAAEEEHGHHGEAVVEVELVLGAPQRVQDPAHEYKRRAALPQQKHRPCIGSPNHKGISGHMFPLVQTAGGTDAS